MGQTAGTLLVVDDLEAELTAREPTLHPGSGLVRAGPHATETIGFSRRRAP